MEIAEITISITAAALAAAALIFALVQTISALSQFLASSNRCGRRITGAFDLRAGIWFSLNTMTANPRYRMPVLTMSPLRTRAPMMERTRTYPNSFRPGRNFNAQSNCYVDGRRSRISSLGNHPTLDMPNTFFRYMVAVLWAPIGAVLTLSMWTLCFPCCLYMLLKVGPKELFNEDVIEEKSDEECCGSDWCTSKSCILFSLKPVYQLFKTARQFKDPDIVEGSIVKSKTPKLDVSVAESQTPGLEAGSWVQFLVSHQRIWWGFADLRWEWRLASLIPTDVYGASLETTVADLELLTVLAGMSVDPSVSIMAATSCGEQVTFSQHGSLGRMAYYRSTRENTRSEIKLKVPGSSSDWFYQCIEACRSGKANAFSFDERYSDAIVDGQPAPTNLPTVIAQLARERTEYDAQLPYSCGSAMWILACKSFQDALKNMHSTTLCPWAYREITVVWGPLGEGINSCSCNRCCDEWIAKYSSKNPTSIPNLSALQWPALKLSHLNSPPPHQTKERLVVGCSQLWENTEATNLASIRGADIGIETAVLCTGNCVPQRCRCPPISRLLDFLVDQHNENKVLGVVGINTYWLRRVDHEILTQAAESLLIQDSQQSSDFVKTVATVGSYTEYSLLKMRQKIGTTNIWNAAASPTLTDFSPLIFGA